jgi:hypothetical protein
MRYFLILLTCIFYTAHATAQQSTAEDSVKAVVNNLFTAMRTADGALFRSTFSDSAILQTFSRKASGNIIVTTENINEFAEFVSRVKKDSADERIRFETIKIDGPMAIVWTPYRFYHNGKFSHCGVNSFQLVKLNGVWKIQYLIDTRRRTNCPPE